MNYDQEHLDKSGEYKLQQRLGYETFFYAFWAY